MPNAVRVSTRSRIFPHITFESSRPLSRAEFLDVLKTIFAAGTFLSLLFAVASFKLEHDWRRSIEAQNILKEWDIRTGEHKMLIESILDRRHQSHELYVTAEEAKEIWFTDHIHSSEEQGMDREHENWELKRHITTLFNYFESVSKTVLENLADEAILKDSLKGPMVDWRNHLREYTSLADQERHRAVWAPYYILADRWDGEDNARRLAVSRIASRPTDLKKPVLPSRSLERR
jgi:hypothetical protein